MIRRKRSLVLLAMLPSCVEPGPPTPNALPSPTTAESVALMTPAVSAPVPAASTTSAESVIAGPQSANVPPEERPSAALSLRTGRPPAAGKPGGGRLPPEVIQRVIRQSWGKFRRCYEDDLKTSPNLQGKVTLSFVIGRDGRVGSVSGVPDSVSQAVASCVVKHFYSLEFPPPEGGVVNVKYPVVFAPG